MSQFSSRPRRSPKGQLRPAAAWSAAGRRAPKAVVDAAMKRRPQPLPMKDRYPVVVAPLERLRRQTIVEEQHDRSRTRIPAVRHLGEPADVALAKRHAQARIALEHAR